MAENTLPSARELRAVTGPDMSITQMPELTQFSGNDQVMVVSNGENYRMDASVFAAELAGSEVSMADVNKKADKTTVVAVEDRLNLLDVKKADKSVVDALTVRVEEVDQSKVNRASFMDVEGRVTDLEIRSARIEQVNIEQTSAHDALARRVNLAETGIGQNAVTAQQGVDAAARADLKAAQALSTANANTASITTLKGRVDAHAISIGTLEVDANNTRVAITETNSAVSGLNTKVSTLELAQSQTAGRVTAIEAGLSAYALQADLELIGLQANQNTLRISELAARQLADRQDIDGNIAAIDALRLELANYRLTTNAAILDLSVRLDALTARVDAITAAGGDIVPDINSIGSVSQPEGYKGNLWSASITNFVTNSKGLPLSTLIFGLEFKRGNLWVNQGNTRFTDNDGGGAVQSDVTLVSGETLEYRVVLKDRYRPLWVKPVREFTFTAP